MLLLRVGQGHGFKCFETLDRGPTKREAPGSRSPGGTVRAKSVIMFRVQNRRVATEQIRAASGTIAQWRRIARVGEEFHFERTQKGGSRRPLYQ